MDIKPYLDFALKTVEKSRKYILSRCQEQFEISTKTDKSVVTEIDLGTEKLIRHEIEKVYPNHGILGEEFGITNETSEFRWIIDPIDGTINFSRGIPLYGTLISLYQGNQPLVGVIDIPGIEGSVCYAAKGLGAFYGNKQIVLKDISKEELSHEIIATGDKKQFRVCEKDKAYQNLLQSHEIVRTQPDAFGHVMAIKGSVGAMIDFDISFWDIAATKLIICEAGGKVTDINIPAKPDKEHIIFGKPAVVDFAASFF